MKTEKMIADPKARAPAAEIIESKEADSNLAHFTTIREANQLTLDFFCM